MGFSSYTPMSEFYDEHALIKRHEHSHVYWKGEILILTICGRGVRATPLSFLGELCDLFSFCLFFNPSHNISVIGIKDSNPIPNHLIKLFPELVSIIR